MKTPAIVKHKVTLQTNRGNTTYTIAVNDKGYWVHELGELTQWAKVFGTNEQKAHRLNPSKRFGNQYGIFWRNVAFKTPKNCIAAIRKNASLEIRRF